MDMPRVINSILLKIRLEILAKKACDKDADGDTKRAICVLLSAAMCKAQIDLVLHGAGDRYGMFGNVAD